MENGGYKSFSYEMKALISCIPKEEFVFVAQSQKEQRLLQKSMSLRDELRFKRKWWKENFLAKPNHQCHVSRLGEDVYIANLPKE